MNRVVEVISEKEWKIKGLHDSRTLVIDKLNQVWVCIPVYHMNGYTNVKPLFKFYG
jgi:hypothetical protein